MLLKRLGYLLSLLLFFSLGYFTAQQKLFLEKSLPSLPVLSDATSTSARLNFSLLNKTYSLLRKHYLKGDQLDSDKLMQGAVRGMLGALGDPYTAFFNEAENQEFKKDLAGVYEGIGAQLGFKNNNLVIIAPLLGSPAQRAGVMAGDVIVKVDQKDTKGMSLPEAVNLIRGRAGTSVILALRRSGVSGVTEISVPREKITVDSILLNRTGQKKQIARLKVLRFGDDTIATWDKIVADIKNTQTTGLILDLRNNPGGYLNAAIYLASEFFKEGTVVVKQAAGNKQQEFKVDHKARLAKMPVVVLVNEGSASAAEILAGALKVRSRAKLVGQKTFGKGTVQEAFELGQGLGVHITTARWLLPDGASINGEGITPDIEVKNSESDLREGKDPQLDKAVELLENDINKGF